VKAAPFEYHAPASVTETLELLDRYAEDDVKVLAGGQSLIPMMALRLARFDHLVDLNRVPSLRYIREQDGMLRIGAMTTQACIARSQSVARAAPLITRATRLIGHFQIRNRGTIGGSLAHADGAAEYPAAALTLDAMFEVTGSNGARLVPAADFFVSAFTTALQPNEILTAVHIPAAGRTGKTGRTGFAVEEMARRRGDFALVGAMCAVGLDAQRRVERAAITFFGVGGVPVRGCSAEQAIIGQAAAQVDATEVGRLAVADLDPAGDVHASGRYRTRVARALAAQVVERALEEAVNGAAVNGATVTENEAAVNE
jgi:aerobic carbon-monoxide dehydrogenase medium subunit